MLLGGKLILYYRVSEENIAFMFRIEEHATTYFDYGFLLSSFFHRKVAKNVHKVMFV
jgi:hypothetical protein